MNNIETSPAKELWDFVNKMNSKENEVLSARVDPFFQNKEFIFFQLKGINSESYTILTETEKIILSEILQKIKYEIDKRTEVPHRYSYIQKLEVYHVENFYINVINRDNGAQFAISPYISECKKWVETYIAINNEKLYQLQNTTSDAKFEPICVELGTAIKDAEKILKTLNPKNPE